MPGATLRILGIDPGLRMTGFGIIEKSGNRLAYVTSGCIRSQATELPQRLASIFEGLRELIDEHAPALVVIEKVFVNVNPQSTLLLGQARGAAICAAVEAGLPVSEYTALQVKQAVVGKGHAGKEQVQEMVKRLLNLPARAGADASDALACAICHAHGSATGRGSGEAGAFYPGQKPATARVLAALGGGGLRMKRGRLV